MEKSYFLLIQNGFVQASTYGEGEYPHKEIMRYAKQYEEDGPIVIAKAVYETPEE